MTDTNDSKPRIFSKWPRTGGIRITLPDDGDDDTRMSDPVPIEPVVNEVLEKQNGIYRVEILSWPGEDQQEWVLFPEKSTRPSKSEQEDEMSEKQEDLGKHGTGTTADQETSTP